MGATLLQRAEDRRQINVDEECNLGLGDEQMTPQTFVGGESAVQCRRGLTVENRPFNVGVGLLNRLLEMVVAAAVAKSLGE